MSREITLVVTMTGSIVLFLCHGVHSRCMNATRSNNTGGSCSFEYNYCGWGDDNDDTNDPKWERLDLFHFGQNSYIRLDFNGSSAGSSAHLLSPWFCATGSDAYRSFTFRYSIQESDRCRLSVFVVTKTQRKEVWETSEGTGIPFSQPVPSIYLQCSSEPFQIMLVGQKLTKEPCGKLYDEIGVDDIIYRDVFVTSTPHHECTTFPTNVWTTEGPPVPLTDDTLTHSIKDESDVNSGAVVAVLVVVATIVAAVVAAVLVWRRKKKHKKQSRSLELQRKTRSMENCTYMTDSDRIVLDVRNVRHENDDVADTEENAGIYSVPDDAYLSPSMHPASASSPPPLPLLTDTEENAGIYSVPDDAYLSPSMHPASAPSPPLPLLTGPRPSRETHTHVTRNISTGGSRYNRLQHHRGDHRHLEQSMTGEHTYDHLAEREVSGSVYQPLSNEANSSEVEEEEEEAMEGRKSSVVSGGSTMVADYVDMNQVSGHRPADLSVYENCD